MHLSKLHFNELLVKYFHNKEMDEIYLSVFLRSLADAFIIIFVPIYLLTLNFSIVDIGIYYIIVYTTMFFTTPIGMYLNNFFGVKKTMAMGSLILMLYYFMLEYLASGFNFPAVAFLYGASAGVYFAAFHIEFSKAVDVKEEGSQLAVIKVIAILTAVMGPFIGSIIIQEISFNALFLISLFVVLLSIFPLFLTPDFKTKKPSLDMKRILKADSSRKASAYRASGALYVSSAIFWPIFIYYITVSDVVSLGAIVSFSSILMIFFLTYIGKLADKDNEGLLKLGVFTHAPSWILRLLFITPMGLFFSNFLSTATQTILDISISKVVYDTAKKTKDIVDYFVFRQVHLFFGRIFILIVAILTGNIYWLFMASFFITFAHLALVKEIKKE